MTDGVTCAVLGSPIQHSRSPAIHRAAYRELALPWAYERHEVGEADFDEFLQQHAHDFLGLSLTMPLKSRAAEIANTSDVLVQTTGVANTLLRTNDTWQAFQTDTPGLAAALRAQGCDPTRTIILGAGATAVAAGLASLQLGARRLTVLARDQRKSTGLAELLAQHADAQVACVGGDLAVANSHDAAPPSLVISTLPGHVIRGAAFLDRWNDATWSYLADAALYDVAYDPWPSPLAELWRSHHGIAHSGLSMLVEQALIQIRIFVNANPDAQLPNETRVRAAMTRAAQLPHV